ncbi:hypothetical protein Tco_1038587, partial [Tanacetum coccineum]
QSGIHSGGGWIIGNGKDLGPEGGGGGKVDDDLRLYVRWSVHIPIFMLSSFSSKIVTGWTIRTLLWRNTSGSRKKKIEIVGKCLTGKLLRMPTVSCFDDLDFFKDFENEFPAIVYNDALTSKSDFLTKPTVSPQHINEFNLKDETSLSECDEEEQNVLYFNDLFSFNVIYPDDSKSDEDNDDDKIDIEHSSRDLSVKPLHDVINTDDGAYARGSNKL